LFGLGAGLNHFFPGLDTNGLQMVVWGFAISTVALYHATFTINSLSHMFGSQRYDTGDTSRNNALLALLTLGEGWHNNHHHYASTARQGFFWWELDFTYYILKLFSLCGIVHHLKPLPEKRRLMSTN
jgi:stearoyl-CoA desaturase (delta-9 desaturase)